LGARAVLDVGDTKYRSLGMMLHNENSNLDTVRNNPLNFHK